MFYKSFDRSLALTNLVYIMPPKIYPFNSNDKPSLRGMGSSVTIPFNDTFNSIPPTINKDIKTEKGCFQCMKCSKFFIGQLDPFYGGGYYAEDMFCDTCTRK